MDDRNKKGWGFSRYRGSAGCPLNCGLCGSEAWACNATGDPALCYNCRYWLARMAEPEDVWRVRINGRQYLVGPVESAYSPDSCRGFEGKLFCIEFPDGRRISTRNLWHNGKIPAHFRDRMPDNARFVGDEPYFI
jgi:hypothetical protein